MEKIQEFDVVELIDGREVTILEIFTKPTLGYLCEGTPTTEDEQDLDDILFVVKPNQIKRVIWKSPN